jgi:integrase/recombinase XerC
MIDKFLNYLQYEKRSSPHTVVSYKNDLEQFSSFLSSQFSTNTLEDATTAMVRTWLASFYDEKLEPSSIKRKISTLKTFYKYLNKIGVLSTNPMLKIVAPKQKSRLPNYVDEKSIITLFTINTDNDFASLRNRLIIELFYQTGIRRAELINLKHTDISKDAIIVLGKRNKERKIPITPALLELITQYEEVKHATGHQLEHLLVLNNGKKLYDKFVYLTVNNYLNSVTTLSKKSPHVLRHTFATHMLNNGADLNAIKEILGHTSLAATQVYTHNSIEKLKSAHKQAHPRA